MRNKDKTETAFSPPPFFRAQLQSFVPESSTSFPSIPQVAQAIGTWGLQSVHNTLSQVLYTVPCCGVGSLPRDIVPFKLFQCGSSTQAVALQKPYQHGSSPWGVLQEWTAPAWAPHGLHFLLLCGRSTGYSFLQSTSMCCGMGCTVDTCSGVVPCGLWGNNLLSSRAAEESLFRHLECFLLFSFTNLGVWRAVSHIFLAPLP